MAELHGPRKPAARHPPAAESRARRRGAARACHTSGPLLHRTRHGHRDAAVSSSRPEFRRDCIGVGITLRFICVDRSSHTSGHESRARTQLGRYTVCRRTVARAPTGTCYEIHTYYSCSSEAVFHDKRPRRVSLGSAAAAAARQWKYSHDLERTQCVSALAEQTCQRLVGQDGAETSPPCAAAHVWSHWLPLPSEGSPLLI